MNFIFKTFIRDYENVNDPTVRTAYGKLAGIVGIITNVLLAATKLVIGTLSGSIAVVADGINNLTDASSSVITLVGFKLAALPEDEEHPYGHARIEYITGLLMALIIIVAGLQLLKDSVFEVIHPTPTEFSWLMTALLAATALAKAWQGLFYRRCGRQIGSVTLSAAATDSRNDIISTTSVIAALLVEKFFGILLDGYIGAFVALFIIYSGAQLIKETSAPLLGEAPDPDLIHAIYEEISKHEGAIGTHDLIVHSYGAGKTFASIHIEVDSEKDIMDSHDMVDDIERAVKKNLNVELTVHMDPVKIGDPLIEELRQIAENAITHMDGVYGIHDLRIVKGNKHVNVVFDVILTPRCKHSKKEIFAAVDTAFSKLEKTYYPVITFDTAYSKKE